MRPRVDESATAFILATSEASNIRQPFRSRRAESSTFPFRIHLNSVGFEIPAAVAAAAAWKRSDSATRMLPPDIA